MAKKTIAGELSVPEETTSAISSLLGKSEIAPYRGVTDVTPYVVFLSSRSKNFGNVVAALPSVKDSDPVLIRPEPAKPIKLDPFRFYLLHAKMFYCSWDNDGYPITTTEDPDRAKDEQLKENVETVIVAVQDDKLYPARCTFKTTKSNAARRAMDAYTQASSDEWGKLSAEHQASLVIPYPQLRFMTSVSLTGATGRKSGLRYVAANGIVRPTGVADWQIAAEWFGNKDNHVALNAVIDAWKKRCEELSEME